MLSSKPFTYIQPNYIVHNVPYPYFVPFHKSSKPSREVTTPARPIESSLLDK